MDKFDKILRDKLQNHDAGMANGAWEQFAQRLNQTSGFENAIREKLEGHDAGMPADAWTKFQQNFKPSGTWKNYLVGGIAASLIGVGLWYAFSPSDEETKNKPVTTENNIALSEKSLTGNSTNNTIRSVEEKSTGESKIKEEIQPSGSQVIDGVVILDNNNNLSAEKANEVKKDNTIKETVKVENNNENKTTANTNTLTPANNIPSLPLPEFTSVREVCQNEELSFKALNKGDFDAVWMINGEEVANGNELKLAPTKAGAFTVQLMYQANVNGKKYTSASEKTTVNVLALPSAEFEINKTNEESIPEYTLSANKAENASYMWKLGDGKFSSETEVVKVYRKKGTYQISLIVTGANGCQNKETSKIEVENDYNLLAPNSFSPNGDGRNDVFIPEALKVMENVQFRMIIFDKSGKKIFETQRIDNAWDGRNTTNGTMSPMGAYVWRVELSLPNGTREEYMGSVTLLD